MLTNHKSALWFHGMLPEAQAAVLEPETISFRPGARYTS